MIACYTRSACPRARREYHAVFLVSPFSFLKKIQFPKLGFDLGPASFVGIDVGSDSVKVVQLRKERERAVLETYGELKVARYFQHESETAGAGFLGKSDRAVANLLTDVLREANVTTRRAVFSIPSTSSFVTLVELPLTDPDEIREAIPFEARRYIPIPAAEVALDWQILESDEVEKRTAVLLAAVPNEVIAKYRRIADLLRLELVAVEVESFSTARALLGNDRGVAAIIHWGAIVTTITVVDNRQIRLSHNFGRGSQEITMAIAHSLNVTAERAEAVKREVGLSEKPAERGVAEVIVPIVDSALADLERAMTNYNRTAKRKIEKIVLSGGGAGLPGLVDHVAKRFGLETAVGNPFSRTVFPAFLQPMLSEIAPSFSVAVGLALRPIAAL